MTTADWESVAGEMLSIDGPAALVCRQWLMAAEGHDAVIFPPTFAAEEASGRKAGYNIDVVDEPTAKWTTRIALIDDDNAVTKQRDIARAVEALMGVGQKRIALIDSVGSQANRMEPLFKRVGEQDTPYSSLVPQIEIKAGNKKKINLLDAGHRAADAIVRYSTLGPDLREAFAEYQESGDARKLAKIAPTSLIFGAWDSRGTQAKLPRLISSTIRAYDVVELKRSAQYFPPLDYVKEDLFEDDFLETKYEKTSIGSFFGLKAAPAQGTHGGVLVRGEIRREAILSLVALRAIGPRGALGESLRQYILGLALVAMTYDRPHDLRQGCLLVGDPEKPMMWELVSHNGQRKSFTADGSAALSLAEKAVDRFGVGKGGQYEFLDKGKARSKIENAIAEKSSGRKGKARRSRAGDEEV